MRMAVIYARVSSEQQRAENTIASQTASLIEFAKNHELEVPKAFAALVARAICQAMPF